MKSSEVRSAFIEYFKKHGHTHVPSSSLIPENDPTLLFANSGMNQFKNCFLGLEDRGYKRAVSSQKCVRAGGKHNDLENVGFTARHHTFFEMLGNFSFGDYFKKDAIHFAWEFLTKDLQIPKDKLYITVHHTDDEAADIWHKQESIPKDRIFKLGDDNFWRMGDTGPCGPSTEIFFDHGPLAGKESDPYKGILSGEDRFVEIWNLVFMQFFEKSPGDMEPLPKPSVDTGSGLERVIAALQGRYNNYNTELFAPIIQTATNKLSWNLEELIQAEMSFRKDSTQNKIAGRNLKQLTEDLASLRVLADHVRSTSFLIADGALPSNDGRGYVLRRIMRRAIRYGQKLDKKQSFMADMASTLIKEMGQAYPELVSRQNHIISTIKDEESRFLQTLEHGTEILHSELAKLKSKNGKELPGEIVFKLYDTYGFPADLTRVMASEQGIHVDEKAFEASMQSAKEKAKASWKGKGIQADEAHLIQFAQDAHTNHKATVFCGYESLESNSTILAISNGKEKVTELKAHDSGLLILNQTPFYAEGGGQVGDQGKLTTPTAEILVHNTTKLQDTFIHHIEIKSGSIKNNDLCKAQVGVSDRRNTMANHSATHLMHAALRQVLGTHVTQAGSTVDSDRLRFDFTHNKPLSADEIQKVETLVNDQISNSTDVQTMLMSHKDAIQIGAMALFGEKYGDQVRVLKMGDFSTELCGGTHVRNTSAIRAFKIQSESGVSSGVRRIEAISGDKAIHYLMTQAQESEKAKAMAGSSDLGAWIENKKSEIKNLEKEIKKLQGAQINIDDLAATAQNFTSKQGKTGKLIFADVTLDDREVLAQITDQLKNKIQSGIVVVVGKGDATHPIIVSVSKELSTEIKAGDLLKEIAAVMGGKGGGRPDFAQGAAPNRDALKQAREKVSQLV